ncbi:MAG: hypothetical protein KDB27_06410 [Planctomycetales bacterium]|nr:hypothetical protein [Planctomycetales bacterium]
MSSKAARRQKKLAKKRSKEVKQRKALAKQRNQMNSLAGRMRAYSKYPVAVSRLGEGAFEQGGICTAYFGRQLGDGQIVLAIFLVDLGCLGIKDAYARTFTVADFARVQERMDDEGTRTVQPGVVLSLLQQAVEYAGSLGFSPRGDFAKMMPIFDGIEASNTETFQFGGDDGKPNYIRGPHESLQEAELICRRLEQAVGEGNYNYIIPIQAPNMGHLGYVDASGDHNDLYDEDDDDFYDEDEFEDDGRFLGEAG